MNTTDLFSVSALLTLVLSLALCGLVGALCGRTRGKEGTGLLAGLFLGPIGWLLILLAYPVQAPSAPPAPSRLPNLGYRRPLTPKDAAWEKAVRGE